MHSFFFCLWFKEFFNRIIKLVTLEWYSKPQYLALVFVFKKWSKSKEKQRWKKSAFDTTNVDGIVRSFIFLCRKGVQLIFWLIMIIEGLNKRKNYGAIFSYTWVPRYSMTSLFPRQSPKHRKIDEKWQKLKCVTTYIFWKLSKNDIEDF